MNITFMFQIFSTQIANNILGTLWDRGPNQLSKMESNLKGKWKVRETNGKRRMQKRAT